LVIVFILFRRINEIPRAGVTIRVAGGTLTTIGRMTDRVPAITVRLLPTDTNTWTTMFGGVSLSPVDAQSATERAR
jgi:hypothetical protein